MNNAASEIEWLFTYHSKSSIPHMMGCRCRTHCNLPRLPREIWIQILKYKKCFEWKARKQLIHNKLHQLFRKVWDLVHSEHRYLSLRYSHWIFNGIDNTFVIVDWICYKLHGTQYHCFINNDNEEVDYNANLELLLQIINPQINVIYDGAWVDRKSNISLWISISSPLKLYFR